MMSYYTRWDKTICEKLAHINHLVKEEWITPAEALATARQLDPTCYVCPKCGALGATGCCCPGDFDKQDILYSEARLYERRINAEWRHYAAYDGGGAIPARYRNARENQRGEWRAL